MTEQSRDDAKLDWPGMYESGFKILRGGPSIVVGEMVARLTPERLSDIEVLDMGCGELRNAAFFASLGANVEAVDLVRPDETMDQLDQEVAERIQYRTMRAQDYPFEPSTFDFVVCTRLIQYLSPDDSTSLLKNMAGSIKKSGGLALNYTVEGGMVGDDSAPAVTFSHDPTAVRETLEETGMTIDLFNVRDGQRSVSTPGFTPSSENLLTCDLVASKW